MRNELVFSFIRFWGKYEKTLPIEQVSSMGKIGQFYRMCWPTLTVALCFDGTQYFPLSSRRTGQALYCKSGGLQHTAHDSFGAIGC